MRRLQEFTEHAVCPEAGAQAFIDAAIAEIVDMILASVFQDIADKGTTIKGIQAIFRHCADDWPGFREDWQQAFSMTRGGNDA